MPKSDGSVGLYDARHRAGAQGICGLPTEQWSPILAEITLDSWDAIRSMHSTFAAEAYSLPVLSAQCGRLPWAAQERGKSPIAAPWRAHLQAATQRRNAAAAAEGPLPIELSQEAAAQAVALHLHRRAERNRLAQRFSEIELLGHNEQIYDAVASPDGRQVLTVCRDKTARVYDVNAAINSTRPSLTYAEQESVLKHAVFVPRSDLVATGGSKGTMHLWRATSGTPQQWAVSLPGGGALQPRCCHTGAALVAQHHHMPEAVVMDVERKARVATLSSLTEASDYWMTAMAQHVDRYVLKASHGAEMWDVSRPAEPKRLVLGKRFDWLKAAAISPCGGFAALVDLKTVTLWDSRQTTKPIHTIPREAASVAYTPAGNVLLGIPCFKKYTPVDETLPGSEHAPIRWIPNAEELECSVDGRWVAAITCFSTLKIVSAKEQCPVPPNSICGQAAEYFHHPIFLPDCQRVMVRANNDQSVHLFDFALPLFPDEQL